MRTLRREAGMDTSWWHAFDVRHSPALPSIIGVAAWLLGLFVAWLLTAQAIHAAHFGDTQPQGLADMVQMMLGKRALEQLGLVGGARRLGRFAFHRHPIERALSGFNSKAACGHGDQSDHVGVVRRPHQLTPSPEVSSP